MTTATPEPRTLSAPNSSAEPVIDVRGLTKRYDSTLVVDNLNLGVRRGEVFGILGANGAGKTTTVECLQGLRRPTSGTIRICGLDPSKDSAKLAPMVGSQLQESGLPDRLRVGEALKMFATERAGPLDNTLEKWGLLEQRRTAFANLSGGQKQRLFVALALLNKPEVVFLDELTQGLDPAARRVVWELIEELRRGGTTVILVTHFVEESEALCDRLAVMANGRVVDVGSPTELIDRRGQQSRMTFSTSPGVDVRSIGALPGVRSVAVIDGRVEVDGDRTLIAHVGAWLVGTGNVPADIEVTQPSLEDALLAILDNPASSSAASTHENVGV